MKPYKAQSDAVKACMRRPTGGVVVPTGGGKSYIMALLIAARQVKTLIVVPNLELRSQLSASMTAWFGSLKNITIENIDSKNLRKKGDYDMILIDECHRSASRSYRDLNKKYWGDIYYRYFFSATFFRNEPEEQLLFEALAGEPIYQLTYQEAVKAGMIVPIDAYALIIPHRDNDYFSYQEVYKNLVVHNDKRNEIIAEFTGNLIESGQSVLILVKEVAHGTVLAELTGLPFCHGQDDDSRAFIQPFADGRISGLIATEGICGEGTDTKACEWVIIAGMGKAKSSLMQRFGRSVRRFGTKESGKVVLVYDKSHKFTKAHYQAQVKILKDEYNVEVIKL